MSFLFPLHPPPQATLFIQLHSAIVFVLPVPWEGSSKVVALAIRQAVRDRKHLSPLFFECILTTFSDKSRVGVRWACFLSNFGADGCAQPGFLPSKVSSRNFFQIKKVHWRVRYMCLANISLFCFISKRNLFFILCSFILRIQLLIIVAYINNILITESSSTSTFRWTIFGKSFYLVILVLSKFRAWLL